MAFEEYMNLPLEERELIRQLSQEVQKNFSFYEGRLLYGQTKYDPITNTSQIIEVIEFNTQEEKDDFRILHRCGFPNFTTWMEGDVFRIRFHLIKFRGRISITPEFIDDHDISPLPPGYKHMNREDIRAAFNELEGIFDDLDTGRIGTA